MQGEAEYGSLGLVFDSFDGATVGGDNGLAEGESQSQTAPPIAPFVAHGIEPVKEPFSGFGRDTRTVVGDLYNDQLP